MRLSGTYSCLFLIQSLRCKITQTRTVRETRTGGSTGYFEFVPLAIESFTGRGSKRLFVLQVRAELGCVLVCGNIRMNYRALTNLLGALEAPLCLGLMCGWASC